MEPMGGMVRKKTAAGGDCFGLTITWWWDGIHVTFNGMSMGWEENSNQVVGMGWDMILREEEKAGYFPCIQCIISKTAL